MLRKILLTLLVIVAVVIFYRIKNARKNQQKDASPANEIDNTINPMFVAYCIIGFIVVFSCLAWMLNLFDNNEVLSVKVINANQQVSTYEVRRKDLKDRVFTTINNKKVRLSENDRVEIIEP